MKPSRFSLVMLVSAIALIFFACSEDSPNSSGSENGGSSSSIEQGGAVSSSSQEQTIELSSSSSEQEQSSSSALEPFTKTNTSDQVAYCGYGYDVEKEVSEPNELLDRNCKAYTTDKEAYTKVEPTLGMDCYSVIGWASADNNASYCWSTMSYEGMLNAKEDEGHITIYEHEIEECAQEYGLKEPVERVGDILSSRKFEMCAREKFDRGVRGVAIEEACINENGTKEEFKKLATEKFIECKELVLEIL